MTEVVLDQATGLRRLLAQSAPRTIAIGSAASAAGRSVITANLAVALARQGRGVVVLDCAPARGSASWLLGAQPRAALTDVVRAASDLRATLAEGVGGIRVARAPALGVALSFESASARLAQVLESLREDADVLLVDAPPGDLVWSAAAGELILLAGPGAQAMTESYRLIKRLNIDGGRRRIHILVNRTQSASHADKIFGNLSATSKRFLNLPLEFLGCIPDDERMVRAARLRQMVVEAFPESECARSVRECADAVLGWNYTGEDGFADFAIRLVDNARMHASTGR
ncbi:MAG TPA: P-loop NTPase [Burkholderiales bacterium]|nr:P-loop NTPase [Burkholderiales bacterium]